MTHSVIDDPRRLEGLLRDYCSAYKREVNVLVAALKERIPFELLKANDSLPQEVLLARLTSRLVEDLGLSEDVAGWAVETWALALVVIAEAVLLSDMQHPPISQLPALPHLPLPVIKPSSELILTLAPDVTLELVRVPAGEFLMGSDKAKDSDASDKETPQHKGYLEEYLIGKYPLIVAQFATFVKAIGYKTSGEEMGRGYIWNGIGFTGYNVIKDANWQHPHGPGSDISQRADHPVTLVNWDDAVAFCKWASQVSEREVRLPSEAEWEKAARGTDGRIYPWGNQEPDFTRCNLMMRIGDTTSVGKYSPMGDSPSGCTDMVGNVWEITGSLMEGYPYNPGDGREDLINRGWLVVRGGADAFNFVKTRCAYRYVGIRGTAMEFFGFRVVVPPISC